MTFAISAQHCTSVRADWRAGAAAYAMIAKNSRLRILSYLAPR